MLLAPLCAFCLKIVYRITGENEGQSDWHACKAETQTQPRQKTKGQGGKQRGVMHKVTEGVVWAFIVVFLVLFSKTCQLLGVQAAAQQAGKRKP